MSIALRAKRATAAAITLAVIVTGLTLSPLTAAPAEAASDASSAAKILKSLNSFRVANGKPKLLTNGFVAAYTKEWNAGIVKKKSINAKVKPKTKLQVDSSTGKAPVGGPLTASATNGSESSRVSRIIKLYKTQGKESVLNDFNYAAFSLTHKGAKTYTTLTLYYYGAAPLDRMLAGTPKIKGTARVGSTLTASPGSFKPAATSYSYRWIAGGAQVGEGKTFVPTAAEKGKKITVKITGTREGYATPAAKSAKTAKAVAAGVITAGKITINGNRNVGQTITAGTGTWKPSTVSYSFQWLRNGKKISGATGQSYALTASDKSKKIDVTVAGKQSGYTTVKKTTKTSAKVGAALP